MAPSFDRLFNLLPAIHRIRDVDQGEPLKAFLSVIAEQVAVLEEDLDQLYDDQFIETCADWVVPYIGDLIGYRQLHGNSAQVGSPRSEVANTIAYRRRKGTAAALEQLARDVTGWPSRVVEFFALLSTTQYMNHLRPENVQCPDLRRAARLGLLGTPFETTSHSLDVRLITKERGRYNIPNVGIFLWRLRTYPLSWSTAAKIADGAYTFNPLGFDAPLFNPGHTPETFEHLARPSDVPEPLRRRPLYGELETLRLASAENEIPPVPTYFGATPVFSVSIAAGPGAATSSIIPSERVLICDLSDWQRPAPQKVYQPDREPGQAAAGSPVSLPIEVAVDPVLGRLTFPANKLPAESEIRVDFDYGFPADLGGGQYTRAEVQADFDIDRGGNVQTALSAAAGKGNFTIDINNSATYSGDLTIAPDPGQRLALRATAGIRPTLIGSITVSAAEGAEVTLDGLLIGGNIQVDGSASMTLMLRDCTLAPWLVLKQVKVPPSLDWADGVNGQLTIERCITGGQLLGKGIHATLSDSIVDALGDSNVAFGPAGPAFNLPGILTIARSTVVGTSAFREINLAENSIFTGPLTSERRQSGCIRFCYVPDGSKTPRRYRCQPETASRQAIDAALKANPSLSLLAQNAIDDDVRTRVRPGFTATLYSQPAYLQLLTSCPPEIAVGAEDETEMGAYGMLEQTWRIRNLGVRLDEYLRFGLEAGVFLVT